MTERTISFSEVPIEELDKELIARGAKISKDKRSKFKENEKTAQSVAALNAAEKLYLHPPALNESLACLSDWELARVIKCRTSSEFINCTRGPGFTGVMELFEIDDEQIKRNACRTALLCLKDNLSTARDGSLILDVKNFGKAFHLCEIEPFRHQPLTTGKMCSGFLVEPDIIAAAASFVDENNIADLRIVFGFAVADENTPVKKFSSKNIYRVVEIIHRVLIPGKEDLVLVRLDRRVEDIPVISIFSNNVFCDREIYVCGYPLGLPLKVAGGAVIQSVEKNYFTADLNVYGSNPGSPVFDLETHEFIGVVGHSGRSDFRWTEKGLLSVSYPGSNAAGKCTPCTRVSKSIAAFFK